MSEPLAWLADDGRVLLEARGAELLGLALEVALRSPRRNGRTVPPELSRLAVLLAAGAQAPEPMLAALPASESDDSGPVRGHCPCTGARVSSATLSTAEAARLLGITGSAVRLAASAGRLRARKHPDGGWRFDPASVEDYKRRRRDGRAR